MLRRDHLKRIGVGAASVSFIGAGFLLREYEEEEEGETKPPHERTFQDLQDGNWDSHVQVDTPVEDLEADVYQAGSQSDGSLQSSIEIEGEMRYTGMELVEVSGMDLRWMMGDSAVQDEASVTFDPPIALSRSGDCKPGVRETFDISVSVSGIQGADRLVITIPEEDVTVSSTC